MKTKVTISFGALAEPLHIQLGTNEVRMRVYQRMADGISTCAIHRVLTESEVARARQRLVQRIGASMKKP